MAGLGESCSHIGAVLFYVEYANRLKETKTVIQDKAYWMPATMKVEYSEIKDINFSASKSLKKSMVSKLQTLPLPSDKEVGDPVNENKIATDEEMDWSMPS